MAVIYACPADKRLLCPWEGYASDIKQHFEKEHNGLLFHTNSVEIDLNILRENRLLYLQEEIYLVQSYIQDNKLFLRLRYLGAPATAAKKQYDLTVTVNGISYKYEKEIKSSQIVLPTEQGWEVDLDALQEIHGEIQTILCSILIRQLQDEIITRKKSMRIHINNSFIEKNMCDDVEEKIYGDISTVETKIKNLSKNGVLEKAPVGDIMDNISCLNLRLFEESSLPSSRKISTNSTISFTDDLKSPLERIGDFLSEISEDTDLLCSSCDNDMLPPIFLCWNGHSVCTYCRKKNCKKCGASITENRNAELENISRSRKHPCKYFSVGCREKLMYNELRAHEAKCQFCKYKCPFEGCAVEEKFEGFVNHLKILHSSYKIKQELSNQFPKNCEFMIVNQAKGIFYCKSEQIKDVISWKAVFCGPRERQFFCELTFKGSKIKDPSFLKRQDNVYEISKSIAELKKVKAKEKYAVLTITCYDG